MGDILRLTDRACNALSTLEGLMDENDRDGAVDPTERMRERTVLAWIKRTMEGAAVRQAEGEWNSKHMPGEEQPHYLKANRRSFTLMQGGLRESESRILSYENAARRRRTSGGSNDPDAA
jgi:hypothetical protein